MTAVWDAVIVGGGLAGSTAGILLRQIGWRVLILDRSEFPRDKVCGEFLSPAIWPFLEKLGLKDHILDQGGTAIETTVFQSPSGRTVKTSLPQTGYGLSRNVLDSLFLLEAKTRGCETFQNCEVQSVTQENGRFQIRGTDLKAKTPFSYETSFVIHTTGGSNRKGSHRVLGFKAHFEGLRPGREVRLSFFKGGYVGLVGIELGLTNVCGLIEEEIFRQKGNSFENLIPPFLLKEGRRVSPWLSCVRSLEYEPSGFRNGIFLAGDSALFLEPFLGQGMTSAVAGAFGLISLLGERPPSSEDFETIAQEYRKNLDRLYQTKILTSRFLRFFTRSPRRSDGLIRILSLAPLLLNRMIRRVSDVPQAFSCPTQGLTAPAWDYPDPLNETFNEWD